MRKGQKMSEEQRLKISQAHKGKKKPWSGKYMTAQHRKAISERMMGNRQCEDRQLSNETKEKIRKSNLGKTHNISEDGRARMTVKNYTVWNKGVRKPKPTRVPKVRGRKTGGVAWNKGLKGYLAGEKNPRWIKDRSNLVKKQERNDSAYKDWRKSVRDRDEWKCKLLNSECSGKVVAHHILTWKNYPELRYKVSNGITLCIFHHPRKRKDELRLEAFFQKLIS